MGLGIMGLRIVGLGITGLGERRGFQILGFEGNYGFLLRLKLPSINFNYTTASFDVNFSSHGEEVRGELESRPNALLQQEQTFWKQRTKVFCLSDGDMNTKFFHQRASNRRKKNLIKGLYDAFGRWCTEDGDLKQIVLNYFRTLFTRPPPIFELKVVSVLPRVITADMNMQLTREIGEEEVYAALKQMHPCKSPGLDGFSPDFYQHFWHIVGRDVIAAVRNFMGDESLLRQLNHTCVTLIPKVKAPESMSQLRPISLCNVLYKIGSKVLANCLKPLLNGIISPFQRAFVAGRLISDNSLVAIEISHFLKNRRSGKKGFAALKLDLSKAYDRVECPFLEAILEQLGFCRVWIRWIMVCVSTVSYEFVVNEEPRGRVLPGRGLRQGDSISPYLFLLCTEVRSKLISRAEAQEDLHGIQICNAAPSHLCNELQRLMEKFWWGDKGDDNKIHWVSWDKLCVLKLEGGLGFRDMHLFNLSLLAKQGWRLIHRPKSLVAPLFKAKYHPNVDFMDAELQSGVSFTWISTEDWLVNDLIDAELHEWLEDVVVEMFSDMEAEIITKIPISLRALDDRLVWHFTPKGIFTVKSCYHVARTASSLHGNSRASSSAGNTRVPTRRNLVKHVPLVDLQCVFCYKHMEDELHLFKNYKEVAPLWLSCPLALRSPEHPTHSIDEWIMAMMDTLKPKQRDLFFVLSWAIWNDHNNIIWKAGGFNSWSMVCWSVRWLEEYQSVHSTARTKVRRPRVQWGFPPSGRLKINVDGAFQSDTGKGGIGVVARDELGVCLAALA
ncbi:uncharacterized protein LOC121050669 [Rosa chinensis]|uniref:uncharacterized protein LOC121050669 n=1 Tax=Rosa chinensis TaxID=74649 RepID=UPI001AD8D981|nr:uncharacterized protein LOC121050669 [Rosa chinensis]